MSDTALTEAPVSAPRPLNPFEMLIFNHFSKRDFHDIRSFAADAKELPGDVGDAVRRGIISAAVHVGDDAFGMELVRLFSDERDESTATAQSGDDDLADFHPQDYGA